MTEPLPIAEAARRYLAAEEAYDAGSPDEQEGHLHDELLAADRAFVASIGFGFTAEADDVARLVVRLVDGG